MTAPIDALVAEAIAKAEAEVGPLDDEGNTAGNNGQDDAFMHERTAHIALAHLATRAAEAEGRAERAEAALIRVVEVGDGVGFDVAVKALREAGLMDPEDDDEEDTAHE